MRLHAYLLSAVAIAAVGYPAFIDPEADGFPLSTYPMFSRDRGRISRVTVALARGEEFERALPPEYVANAETMQAMRTLSKGVRAGPRRARKLCRAIADRIAARGEAEFAPAREVALVTLEVDSIEYLAGETGERSRHVHMRCGVEGR